MQFTLSFASTSIIVGFENENHEDWFIVTLFQIWSVRPLCKSEHHISYEDNNYYVDYWLIVIVVHLLYQCYNSLKYTSTWENIMLYCTYFYFHCKIYSFFDYGYRASRISLQFSIMISLVSKLINDSNKRYRISESIWC